MVQVNSLLKPVVLSAVGRHVIYLYQIYPVFLRVVSTIAQPIGGLHSYTGIYQRLHRYLTKVTPDLTFLWGLVQSAT